jgi:ATP-dependent exoDNAse (exonuclease V) beta subunit
MAAGADPSGIMAFTFIERAAEELKARISARVAETLGPESLRPGSSAGCLAVVKAGQAP